MKNISRLLRWCCANIVLVLLLIVFYIAKRLSHEKARSGNWVKYEAYQAEIKERHESFKFVLSLMKFYYRIAGLKGKVRADKNRRVSDFRYEMF